jgi:hypothetical protein
VLRVGFLASDFNPMVLILGEAEDLHRLTGILRRFARDQHDVLLGPGVTLTGSAGVPGIQPSPEPSAFLWRLDADRADDFAERIDQLAQPSCAAGSEILECGSGEEIPVKVSRGEFTDDFLVPSPAQPVAQ